MMMDLERKQKYSTLHEISYSASRWVQLTTFCHPQPNAILSKRLSPRVVYLSEETSRFKLLLCFFFMCTNFVGLLSYQWDFSPIMMQKLFNNKIFHIFFDCTTTFKTHEFRKEKSISNIKCYKMSLIIILNI